jgi:hypothetical protein
VTSYCQGLSSSEERSGKSLCTRLGDFIVFYQGQSRVFLSSRATTRKTLRTRLGQKMKKKGFFGFSKWKHWLLVILQNFEMNQN